MTDAPYDEHGTAGGEQETAPHPAGSFGDQAAEMANETEVEEPTPAEDELSSNPVVEEGEARARLETKLAERTDDLQRLQAEFMNYKRRVERDRDLIKENATYAALAPITEVLDTIDRAREHCQKSGQSMDPGFAAVADQLERTVAALGLARFGVPGEAFDPTLHEALSHIGEDPEVQVTTCKVIVKAGYRIGERVVRAAQVLVVDPPAGATE